MGKCNCLKLEKSLKTFQMREDMNLEMDEFVIMPNHFHASL